VYCAAGAGENAPEMDAADAWDIMLQELQAEKERMAVAMGWKCRDTVEVNLEIYGTNVHSTFDLLCPPPPTEF